MVKDILEIDALLVCKKVSHIISDWNLKFKFIQSISYILFKSVFKIWSLKNVYRILRCNFDLGSRSFSSNVDLNEDKKKVDIKIKFTGHKFKEEDLTVRVTKRNRLIVKLEDDEEKFRETFRLPESAIVDKIESTFDVRKGKVQTITISIPKNTTAVPTLTDDDEYYYLS